MEGRLNFLISKILADKNDEMSKKDIVDYLRVIRDEAIELEDLNDDNYIY